ncbi:MAG: permease [Phycisphaerales bacterium]
MPRFFDAWADSALTTLGFFWMALWAFCLGYIVSSMIQVFVTRERMRRTMGVGGVRSVALGAFFGFISSSCSFAALSTTRSLFQKGAGLAASLAFLLASTNLVIELGILIFVFLSWQFVVGEYMGGVLLILCTWALVRLLVPRAWIERAREVAREAGHDHEHAPSEGWRERMGSLDGWSRVGRRYLMEWNMVWKDVLFGFTVAGVIAAFVPPAFFRTLFVGSGAEGGAEWWQVVLHTLIGPVAAFFTFIGSMGNIPLAAILFGSGVSFAGVMAFIFSDLVVFPVVRIAGRYFGWRMAWCIVGIFLMSLIVTSLVLHWGFELTGLLPEAERSGAASRMAPEERFALDHTFVLNIVFVLASLLMVWLSRRGREDHGHGHDHGRPGVIPRVMRVLAWSSVVWLGGGVLLWLVRG